jgi:hypothetical protein
MAIALARRFSYVSAEVLVLGCRRGKRTVIQFRSENDPVWSRSIEVGERLGIRIPVDQVNFLVLAAMSHLRGGCTRRVGWSNLRFG